MDNVIGMLERMEYVVANSCPVLVVFMHPFPEATVFELRKTYKKMAVVIHPDKVHESLKQRATVAIGILNRAKELVNAYEQYQQMLSKQDGEPRETHVINDDVVYTELTSWFEFELEKHEQHEAALEDAAAEEKIRKEKAEEAAKRQAELEKQLAQWEEENKQKEAAERREAAKKKEEQDRLRQEMLDRQEVERRNRLQGKTPSAQAIRMLNLKKTISKWNDHCNGKFGRSHNRFNLRNLRVSRETGNVQRNDDLQHEFNNFNIDFSQYSVFNKDWEKTSMVGMRHMTVKRHVEVAALINCRQSLAEIGYNLYITTTDCRSFKKNKKDAAEQLHHEKTGSILDRNKLEEEVLRHSGLNCSGAYYTGLTIVSPFGKWIAKHGLSTWRVQMRQLPGNDLQTYGTVYQILAYDSNCDAFPVVFRHAMQVEHENDWEALFNVCHEVQGFDVEGRVVIIPESAAVIAAFNCCGFINAQFMIDPQDMVCNLERRNTHRAVEELELFVNAATCEHRRDANDMMNCVSLAMTMYVFQYRKENIFRSYAGVQHDMEALGESDVLQYEQIMEHVVSLNLLSLVRYIIVQQESRFMFRVMEEDQWQEPCTPYVKNKLEQLKEMAEKVSLEAQPVQMTQDNRVAYVGIMDRNRNKFEVNMNATALQQLCTCKQRFVSPGIPCIHAVYAFSKAGNKLQLYDLIPTCYSKLAWHLQYSWPGFTMYPEYLMEAAVQHVWDGRPTDIEQFPIVLSRAF